jgi:hypothetical protein
LAIFTEQVIDRQRKPWAKSEKSAVVPTKSILTAANMPILAAIMFLRCKVRRKNGKQHRYWSVVENTRVGGGRVVQRHVLYLGEINDTQELAWRRSIEVLEDGAARPRTLSLFPEDRVAGLLADASVVGVRLSELRLRRPRAVGRVLADADAVARAAARSVLVEAAGSEPQKDALG